MLNQANLPKPRRGRSADALIETLRRRFQDVPDHRRQASCGYAMSDTLMSAFAMFATKEPSMLSFEDHQRELHIEKLFKIDAVPSDTQMREILDGIDIEHLNQAFADHQYLFDQVIEKMDQDNYRIETYQVASAKKKFCTETSYVAGVSLNKTHADVQVNFLQHYELECSDGAVTKRFSCRY